MNKKMRWFYRLIANCAQLSVASTNLVTCFFIFHQPEVPEEAKNFKFGKK